MVWSSTTTAGFGVKGKFAVARYCAGQDLATTSLLANEEYVKEVHQVKDGSADPAPSTPIVEAACYP